MAKSNGATWLVQPGEESPTVPRKVFGWRRHNAVETPPETAVEAELAQITAAQHDLAAFAPLYEEYVDLVWRYALSRLGDHHRAADATSVTFQRTLAALPKFKPQQRGEITTFRSWLMTIARNVVIDESRRSVSSRSIDDPAIQPWLVEPGHGPEALAVASEERRRIEGALAQLPATQRQIVELRSIGLKGAEIATVLNMTESAIKTAHFRAMHRLRDLLTESDDQGNTR